VFQWADTNGIDDWDGGFSPRGLCWACKSVGLCMREHGACSEKFQFCAFDDSASPFGGLPSIYTYTAYDIPVCRLSHCGQYHYADMYGSAPIHF
jgi:hypothetical protein